MPQEKKKPSLRLVGVLFVGGTVVLFIILILGILYTNLPKMLQQAENRFLQKQVEGVYNDALDNAYRMTYDVAIWEEAVRYAEGEYPTLIEDSWPDASLLDNYRFNFVYIKDKNGDDLHVEFYDYLKQMTHFESVAFTWVEPGAPRAGRPLDRHHRAGTGRH